MERHNAQVLTRMHMDTSTTKRAAELDRGNVKFHKPMCHMEEVHLSQGISALDVQQRIAGPQCAVAAYIKHGQAVGFKRGGGWKIPGRCNGHRCRVV